MDMQQYIQPIKQKLDQLEPRERTLVISGAVFVLVSLLYLLIWDPIFSELDKQEALNNSRQQQLIMLQEAENEIRQLKRSGLQISARYQNQSVSSLASMSASSMGVKQSISKMNSVRNGVNADLENASFDNIIRWLDDMQKYGISATKVIIEPQQKSGAVNARITLERAE